MQALGSVGDADIQFINLSEASKIENLFEHVSVSLRMRTHITIDL
jgi:hypothetical protein